MTDSNSSDAGVDRRALLGSAGVLVAAGSALGAGAVHAADTGAASGTPSLRRPGREAPSRGAVEPFPGLAIIALNRLAFGPRPGDVAAFRALGATGIARLTAYVDQQIDWQSIPDPVANGRIAASSFSTLGKTRQQLWVDHVANGVDSSLPREELTRATFLRAIYSERQLLEVMADFWHNHFNVDALRFVVRSLCVNYDRDVIRANAFGNFRQMLEEVAMSASMLYYLDNYTSSNAGPNENFCRELFELHTLGSENYYGVIPQNQVPDDGGGVPLGYVDADVFEATRCFTGWTLENSSSSGANDGSFFYRTDWHDRFQKNVIGVFIPQDQPPLKDGRDVLDALAAHPGTGRHIARKLCRRLIADDPPQSIVDAAAALFTAQKDAPDQIAQVVRLIALSTEFRTTWSEKTKRPFEIAAAAMRAGQANFNMPIGDSDTNSFLSRYNDAGQPLFRRPTPDGFPDLRVAWHSTTPRAISWRLVNWLIDVRDDGDIFRLNVLAQTPATERTATELADFWINRILGRPLSEDDRQDVIDFMAQGFNPDLVLPIDTNTSLQDRLRSMVGLILMTPSFLLR